MLVNSLRVKSKGENFADYFINLKKAVDELKSMSEWLLEEALA
jgi:hypothetical protein